jgi:hypothetical protein
MSRLLQARWTALGLAILVLGLTVAVAHAEPVPPPSFPDLPPGPSAPGGPGLPPAPPVPEGPGLPPDTLPRGGPGMPPGPDTYPSPSLVGTWASRMLFDGRMVTLYLTLDPYGNFQLTTVDDYDQVLLQIRGRYTCGNGSLILYANGSLFGRYQVTGLTFNRLVLNGREHWARVRT